MLQFLPEQAAAGMAVAHRRQRPWPEAEIGEGGAIFLQGFLVAGAALQIGQRVGVQVLADPLRVIAGGDQIGRNRRRAGLPAAHR